MVVPAGTTTGVETCAGSLSSIFQPETFTDESERFLSSTQSATWSPLDSTSLMTTSGGPSGAHALAAPLVEATVVSKSPVPSGQRPYVVVACAVQLYESRSVVPSAPKSRAVSAPPRPKPPVTSTSGSAVAGAASTARPETARAMLVSRGASRTTVRRESNASTLPRGLPSQRWEGRSKPRGGWRTRGERPDAGG